MVLRYTDRADLQHELRKTPQQMANKSELCVGSLTKLPSVRGRRGDNTITLKKWRRARLVRSPNQTMAATQGRDGRPRTKGKEARCSFKFDKKGQRTPSPMGERPDAFSLFFLPLQKYTRAHAPHDHDACTACPRVRCQCGVSCSAQEGRCLSRRRGGLSRTPFLGGPHVEPRRRATTCSVPPSHPHARATSDTVGFRGCTAGSSHTFPALVT